MVQWLGLGGFTAGAQVQLLVGEPRYRNLCGVAKTKNKTKKHLLMEFTILPLSVTQEPELFLSIVLVMKHSSICTFSERVITGPSMGLGTSKTD